MLIFTKGTVGKIFDLRKNGEKGTVKNGFRSIFSYFLPLPFSPNFVPLSSTTSRHNPPQPTSHVLCPLFPHFPPFPSIFLHFPPFPPISPIFLPLIPFSQTPKSWFDELVSSVAVSADA